VPETTGPRLTGQALISFIQLAGWLDFSEVVAPYTGKTFTAAVRYPPCPRRRNTVCDYGARRSCDDASFLDCLFVHLLMMLVVFILLEK